MTNKDGAEEGSATGKRLVFAYYVTGHGFGHATRGVEVVRHLILAGHDVHVVTGAPDFVFTTQIQSPRLFLRKLVLDCGVVQADALTVDRLASLEKYSETAVVPRDSILATEAKWLKSIKADLVVSDVVPVACRAAADAGIRAVCVTNFSWDFIYAEYVVVAGYHHRSIVWQIAEDYSHCQFLIRLPGYCPMPAFRDVVDVPLVVRRPRKSRKEVRQELGISEDKKVVILNFGGQESRVLNVVVPVWSASVPSDFKLIICLSRYHQLRDCCLGAPWRPPSQSLWTIPPPTIVVYSSSSNVVALQNLAVKSSTACHISSHFGHRHYVVVVGCLHQLPSGSVPQVIEGGPLYAIVQCDLGIDPPVWFGITFSTCRWAISAY
ncbi:hypothetical protein L6452_32137 [Arctium lappa]|uniref:Uncharacterized protein n=1 Tax=Arctium lappa TaxID=4217 RepID=A0ACB8Z401_ARCLA|nr:hypothetical protein L6452_32137 [Arctium lappa]